MPAGGALSPIPPEFFFPVLKDDDPKWADGDYTDEELAGLRGDHIEFDECLADIDGVCTRVATIRNKWNIPLCQACSDDIDRKLPSAGLPDAENALHPTPPSGHHPGTPDRFDEDTLRFANVVEQDWRKRGGHHPLMEGEGRRTLGGWDKGTYYGIPYSGDFTASAEPFDFVWDFCVLKGDVHFNTQLFKESVCQSCDEPTTEECAECGWSVCEPDGTCSSHDDEGRIICADCLGDIE